MRFNAAPRDGEVVTIDSGALDGVTWAMTPPTGSIVAWAGAVMPAGWLECDGSSRRQSAYPELYAVIGKAFGGTTLNFNVPDLRGLQVPGPVPALRWIVKT